MSTDSLGRSDGRGSIPLGDLAAALNSPTASNVNVGGSSGSGSLGKAVADVAAAKGDNSAQSDRQWVEKLISFLDNFKKGGGGGGGGEVVEATTRVAVATEGILKAATNQNKFWVSISNIGAAAQKAIAKAFSMSDCCTNAAKAAKSGPGGGRKGGGSGGSGGGSFDVSAIPMPGGGGGRRGGGGGGKINIPPAPGGGGGPPPLPGAGGGGRGGRGMPSVPGMGGGNVLGSIAGVAQAATAAFTIMYNKMIQVMDLDPFKHVFQGAMTESNAFRENLRQTLHQQIGFVANNRAIEDSYKNITESVSASGVRRGEFQRVWLQNLQRGIMLEGKGEKMRATAVRRVMSVTTSALNTAQSLGMNVDSTNEMFMNWHYHLSMSALDIADMGRHMQTVARNTGITGKELEKAMASSDKIMRSLKSAGSATAEASKNVMSLSAAMQKHGVGEQAGQMMGAMSSRASFFQASPEMRSMLTRIGANSGDPNMVNSVMSGTVLQSRSRTRQFGEGMGNEMRSFLTNFQGDFQRLGVQMPTDMTKLSETIQELQRQGPEGERLAGVIDQMARQRFAGMGVGDLEQFMKGWQELGKTSGDRINDMTKRMQDMQRRGLTNLDEYRQLQRQMTQAQTDQSMTAFTQVQRELTRAGVSSYDQLGQDARARLERTLGDDMGREAAQQFLGNMGRSANELMQSVSQRAQAAGLDVNKLLQKRGINNMEEAAGLISQGGEQGERAMMALNEAMQEIGQKERTSQDPITDIRENLREANNKLGQILDSALFKLGNGVAQAVFWLGQAVTILGSIWGMYSAYSTVSGFLGMGSSAAGAGGGGLGALGFGGGAAAGLGGSIASVLGAIVAPLLLVVGGVKGYMEAKEDKQTKGEGAFFGALTGGAGTGSWLSQYVGIEKDSAGDKAMGVGMAATWAAAIGAAIGTFIFPGVGTAIGAAIGAVVGAVVEIVKILTEGTQLVQKYLIDPIMWIITPLWDAIKGLWDIVVGIFTLDMSRIGEGLFKILKAAFDLVIMLPIKLVQRFGELIFTVLMQIPGWILQGLKFLWVTLPMMILDGISAALQWLASNEYVGAIFAPILELWDSFADIFRTLYTEVGNVFDFWIDIWDELKGSFMSIIEPIFGVGEGGGFLSGVMSVLGTTIKVLATIIGWVLKVVLWPFVKVFQVIGWVVKGVIAVLKPVFSWIWEALKVMGEILYYIGAIVLWPVIKAFQLLGKLFGWLAEVIGPWITWLGEKWAEFVDWMEPVLSPLWEAIKAVGSGVMWFLETIWWPFGKAIEWVGWAVGEASDFVMSMVRGIRDAFKWLYDVLYGHSIVPDLIYGIISFFTMLPVRIISGLASMAVDILKTIGTAIWNGLNSVLGGIPNMLLGGLKSVFGSLFSFLGGLVGGLMRAAGNVVQGFRETNDQANERIAESGNSLSHGVGRTAGGVWEMLSGGESGFFSISGRIEGFKKTLGGAWEAVSAVGETIYDSAKSALSGISGMWDSVWSSVGGFFSSIDDFFGGAISGIGEWASETWDSATSAVGGALESAGNFLGGLVGNSNLGTDIGSAIGSGLSAVGSAVAESPLNPLNWFDEGTREVNQGGLAVLHPGEMIIPKEVWNQIKAVGNGPFGGGQEEKSVFGGIFSGIDSMLGGGPSSLLSSAIDGVGSLLGFSSSSNEGAFAKGEVKEAMAQDVFSKLAATQTEAMEVHDPILAAILEKAMMKDEEHCSETTMALKGAFESGEGSTAMDTAQESWMNSWSSNVKSFGDNVGGPIGSWLSQVGDVMDSFSQTSVGSSLDSAMTTVSSTAKGGLSNMLSMGLFSNDIANDALSMFGFGGSELNNVASSALDAKSKGQKKQILAELSQSLNYDQTASETANANSANSVSVYGQNVKVGEVNPNDLDYSDQLSGEVSTLGLSRATVEGSLEQDRAGVAGAGSSVIPSMDAIAEYLMVTQAAKFDDMIEHLAAIRENTANRGSAFSEIIGAVSGGMPLMSKPGVKSIAKDLSRGFWDLTFGDNAAGGVTTEGRGGSS